MKFFKLKVKMSLGKFLTWILILLPVIISGFYCLFADIISGPIYYTEEELIKTVFRIDLFQTFILSVLPVYSFPLGGIVANGVVQRVKPQTNNSAENNLAEPA